MNILKLYRRNNKTTDSSGEIQYDEMRCKYHYLTRTGVEKDARPHIIRRSSSPVIPRFLNSCIVTFPTRCKNTWNEIITMCHSSYDIFIDEIEN